MEKKYEFTEVLEVLKNAPEVVSIFHETEYKIHINSITIWFTNYTYTVNKSGYFTITLYSGNYVISIFSQSDLEYIY